jgi:hypothetical protein
LACSNFAWVASGSEDAGERGDGFLGEVRVQVEVQGQDEFQGHSEDRGHYEDRGRQEDRDRIDDQGRQGVLDHCWVRVLEEVQVHHEEMVRRHVARHGVLE